MAIDFPASPANGATHTAAGAVWRYDGVKWTANSAASPGDITGVAAGTGLTGGGTIGDLTLALQVPVSIANGGTGSSTAAAAPWVETAGDTMTGNLTISPASGIAQLTLNKSASGLDNSIYGDKAGLHRWVVVLGDASAESGGAGSDFIVARYNDAGAWVSSPLSISRINGFMTLAGAVYVTPNPSTTWAGLSLNKSADGSASYINGLRNSNLRWGLKLGDAASESGSNAGSNFSIEAYNDAGAYSHTPFSINRASGVCTFAFDIFFGGNRSLAWTYSDYINCAASNTMTFAVGGIGLWNLRRSDNLAFNGNGPVGGFGAYANLASFARMKSNIRPIADPAERIKRLKPRAYRHDLVGEEQHGFVIEDLVADYPETIKFNPETGAPEGYRSEIIIAGLTAALQDALRRIEALERA